MPMQTVHRTEEVKALGHKDNSKGTGGSPTDKYDPWNPDPHHPLRPPIPTGSMCPMKKMDLHLTQLRQFVANFRASNIIVPDRTPQRALLKFLEIYNRLGAILEKDSIRRFLRLYQKHIACMAAGLVVTPQTFDLIIRYNALRCAKLVLEGKEPKLWGLRANPNYITSFGYFPLHQAAETFSADMIELLLRYGALASLRTSGDRIIEGLLPLHVAIENTCQHKYLEDNLLDDQNYRQANVKYIYKLIHLLCLPEMKIFLDTIRLLASHTDNVVDELLDYIKHEKLVPAAILLLAAQRQFRDQNGFDMIKNLIEDSWFSVQREGCGLERGKNTKAQRQLKEKKAQFSNALVLVRIILKAGEALDAYIQTHSEASHQEVLGKVSTILQDYDVGPSGKGICIEDLNCCPYDCGMPNVLKKHGDTDLTKAAIGSPTLKAEAKNKPLGRDELWYKRCMFFPEWRSVLKSRFIGRFFPAYVPKKELPFTPLVDDHMAHTSRKKLKDKRSPPIRLGLLEGRLPQSAINHQSRRLFGTAASDLLKILKRA